MNPIQPHLGVSIGHETVIAKEQPPYLPLVAHVYGSECWGSPVVTRWRLSWRERVAALFGRDLYVRVLTFDKPFPPIHMGFDVDAVRYLTASEHDEFMRSRPWWWRVWEALG